MNKEELKNIIADCCNDVIFVYRDKQAGVTSEVSNYIPTFQAWYGNDTREYENVEDVMNDPFFGGKSLADLIGEVEFDIL